MELLDTIGDMISTDYKKRFIAEYNQLDIRINKLHNTLKQYYMDSLDFKLSAPIEILEAQLSAMEYYKFILKERAKLEGIKFD